MAHAGHRIEPRALRRVAVAVVRTLRVKEDVRVRVALITNVTVGRVERRLRAGGGGASDVYETWLLRAVGVDHGDLVCAIGAGREGGARRRLNTCIARHER